MQIPRLSQATQTQIYENSLLCKSLGSPKRHIRIYTKTACYANPSALPRDTDTNIRNQPVMQIPRLSHVTHTQIYENNLLCKSLGSPKRHRHKYTNANSRARHDNANTHASESEGHRMPRGRQATPFPMERWPPEAGLRHPLAAMLHIV